MPPFLKYMVSILYEACGNLWLMRFIVSFANHWPGTWISSSRGCTKTQIAPNGQAVQQLPRQGCWWRLKGKFQSPLEETVILIHNFALFTFCPNWERHKLQHRKQPI